MGKKKTIENSIIQINTDFIGYKSFADMNHNESIDLTCEVIALKSEISMRVI